MPEELGDIEVGSPQPEGGSPPPEPGDGSAPAPSPIVAAPSPDRRGPIPLDRHEEILRSTRRDYEDQLAELAWARGRDPDRVRSAMDLFDRLERDPTGFHRDLGQRIETEPGPDIELEDGRRTYSPERAGQLARFAAREAVEQLRSEWEPRLGTAEQYTREARAYQHADDQIAAASEWPGFAEFEGDIADAIASARARGHTLTLEGAYLRVALPKLLQSQDSLRKTEREAILKELNHTSEEAADTVNPARKPSPRVRPDHERPITELLAEEMARRKLA